MGKLEQLVQPLLGQICWQARWDHQLGLDLNFGQPRLLIRQPYPTKSAARSVQAAAARRLATVRGTFWLWALVGRWRITLPDNRQATASSSVWTKDVICKHFEGERVKSVQVDARSGRTRISFDLGSTLDLWRIPSAHREEIWSLYAPRGWVLTVRGDGTYSYGRGSAKDKWKPIPRLGAT